MAVLQSLLHTLLPILLGIFSLYLYNRHQKKITSTAGKDETVNGGSQKITAVFTTILIAGICFIVYGVYKLYEFKIQELFIQ